MEERVSHPRQVLNTLDIIDRGAAQAMISASARIW
jgi:hypothetical protein